MSPRRDSYKRHRGLERIAPPPEALSRLKVVARTPSGTAKHWRDPVTGKTYSNRKRQETVNGGLTIERYTRLKRDNPRMAEHVERSRADYRAADRERSWGGPERFYINYENLADRYAQTWDVDDSYSQTGYWNAVDEIERFLAGELKWKDIADDMWDWFGAEDADALFYSDEGAT